jgi:hypothetical protein
MMRKNRRNGPAVRSKGQPADFLKSPAPVLADDPDSADADRIAYAYSDNRNTDSDNLNSKYL